MKRAKVAAPMLSPVLTIADCVVRAARGRQNRKGGVVYSGALWVRDQPVASFHNIGEGGCCTWAVFPEQDELFAEFEALAKRMHPELNFEWTDHVAGALWDLAILGKKS